jgi:hypothetical protein
MSLAMKVLATLGVMGAAAASAFLTIKLGTLLPVAVGTGLLLLAAVLARPDVGSLVFVALAYSNGIALIGAKIGDASIIAAGFSGILCIPIFVHVFVKREPWIIDYPFLLMILFGGATLLSSMMAKDVDRALAWVMTFVTEGLLLYFLLMNAIRSLRSLRAVASVLVLVGAALGSFAIYQELTGQYDQQFGGLMQRNTTYGYEDEGLDDGFVRDREKVRVAHRAGGPTGGPNRCAQILLTVLPVALFRLGGERTGKGRLIAAGASVLILSGILLTYSRGGFLNLIALVLLLTILGYLRFRQLIVATVVTGLLLIAIAPGYVGRIESVVGLERFTTEAVTEKKQGDATIRGRLTEMLASLHVFLDYPLLGVGPSQYSPYYSIQYMANPDIAFRDIDKSRRAHILYFELAAETGIVGLGLFMAIAMVVLRNLWRSRQRLKNTRPDLAHLAMGFFLGLLMYFGAAMFLHFSYQRFYWIALAIAGVCARLLAGAETQPTAREERGASAWLAEETEFEAEAVGVR